MSKKAKIVVICICIVAVLAIGAAVGMFLMMMNKENNTDTGDVYVMDEGNYQEILDNMNEQVQEGYFETYMTVDWIFPDGSSEASDAMLGNSPNNTKPIRCELLLKDTGEKLFETKVLPVGTIVSPIKLNRDLDAGTYEATCMIYLMNEIEDGKFEDYSSAGFNVTLIIQN